MEGKADVRHVEDDEKDFYWGCAGGVGE